MFLGEYQHSLDAKGRITIPARFRDQLGEKFVATKGLDNCIFLY
ncbi:MAG TPA: cell division/cell wall cluster transcriptional repressor MraZ, partial [Syntrophomonas sp.]|nr:cell division/cell wall cluster transcriptional repressor MraZ [Syntrophomonas sp.]